MGGTLTSAIDSTKNQGDRGAHGGEVWVGGGDFRSAEGRIGLARSTGRSGWIWCLFTFVWSIPGS